MKIKLFNLKKKNIGQKLYVKEEKLHEHNSPPDESLIYMIVPKVINIIHMFVVLGINMYQKIVWFLLIHVHALTLFSPVLRWAPFPQKTSSPSSSWLWKCLFYLEYSKREEPISRIFGTLINLQVQQIAILRKVLYLKPSFAT